MRRLGRFILNGLTGLSLLICLATVVLWAGFGDGQIIAHHSGRVLNALAALHSGIEYHH